jgi:hypothetical protein
LRAPLQETGRPIFDLKDSSIDDYYANAKEAHVKEARPRLEKEVRPSISPANGMCTTSMC